APRQQLALGAIAKWTRAARSEVLRATGDAELAEAVTGYLYCALAKVANRNSSVCSWQTGAEKVRDTFARYAIPMTWDFCEVPPSGEGRAGSPGGLEGREGCVNPFCEAAAAPVFLSAQSQTADLPMRDIDALVTDPPYYGAIPYADLSDFFYVWLR